MNAPYNPPTFSEATQTDPTTERPYAETYIQDHLHNLRFEEHQAVLDKERQASKRSQDAWNRRRRRENVVAAVIMAFVASMIVTVLFLAVRGR